MATTTRTSFRLRDDRTGIEFATVTLEESSNGILQVTLILDDLSRGGIGGIFFDVAGVTSSSGSRLNDFKFTSTSDTNGPSLNASQVSLNPDRVTNVGSSSIGGSTPGFDVGVDASTLVGASPNVATFFISRNVTSSNPNPNPPSLLNDFSRQRFGVRLKSSDGTSSSETARLFGTVSPLVYISGVVFEDTDRDGVRDPGERLLPGITVTWAGPDGQFDPPNDPTPDDVSTTTNDDPLTPLVNEAGTYRLAVSAGIASQIRFSRPDGFTFTAPNSTGVVAINPRANTTIDVGLAPPPPLLTVTRQTYINNAILQAYDGNGDGVQELVYLVPKIDQTFDQVFRIENSGSGTATGQELIISAVGSPYVDLNSIRISNTNDGDVTIEVTRINADQFRVVINGLDGNTTRSPSNNKFIELNVNSIITNPTDRNRITTEPLSFNLRDDNNPLTTDFGEVTVNAHAFFSEAGFSTSQSTITSQRTGFGFAPFASSQVNLDFTNPTFGDRLGQAATVARIAGSFTDKNGIFRNLFLNDLTGDLDLITRSTGRTKSNPLDISLSLVWFSDLVLPIAPFTGNDTTDYQTFLNTYVNGGYFDAAYAAEQRKGVIGSLTATDPTTGQTFTQAAVAGDLGRASISTSLTTIDFPITGFPNLTFQQFVSDPARYVSGFDPSKTYLIRVASNITSIEFFQYNQTTAAINIGAIQFLASTSTSPLIINNGFRTDNLDLSGTIILNASGQPIGARIFGNGSNTQGPNFDVITGSLGNDVIIGTNGDDTLRGSFGNDTLTGANGKDTFVLARGEGSDTITDFRTNLDQIALAGGLRRGQLNFSGSQIRFGNEVLATLTGVTNFNNVNFIEIP